MGALEAHGAASVMVSSSLRSDMMGSTCRALFLCRCLDITRYNKIKCRYYYFYFLSLLTVPAIFC